MRSGRASTTRQVFAAPLSGCSAALDTCSAGLQTGCRAGVLARAPNPPPPLQSSPFRITDYIPHGTLHSSHRGSTGHNTPLPERAAAAENLVCPSGRKRLPPLQHLAQILPRKQPANYVYVIGHDTTRQSGDTACPPRNAVRCPRARPMRGSCSEHEPAPRSKYSSTFAAQNSATSISWDGRDERPHSLPHSECDERSAIFSSIGRGRESARWKVMKYRPASFSQWEGGLVAECTLHRTGVALHLNDGGGRKVGTGCLVWT